MTNLEDLEKLHQLKKKGIISEQEFEQQKRALLQTSSTKASANKSQIAYCLLALFLGQLGIHNFYVGRWKRGLAQLLLTSLSPLTFSLSLFVSNLWSIINIFTIHTDGKGKEFDPNPVARLVCGILGIIWYVVIFIGIMAIGGIAGYTAAMKRYKANELANYAAMVSVIAQTTEDLQSPIDCLKLYPAPNTVAFEKCEAHPDHTVTFSGIDSSLKETLLEIGAKQDSAGNLYFQF